MSPLYSLHKTASNFIQSVNKHPATQEAKRDLRFVSTFAAMGAIGGAAGLAIAAATWRPLCITGLSICQALNSDPSNAIGFCQAHLLNSNTLTQAVIEGAKDSAFVAAAYTGISLMEKSAQKVAKAYKYHLEAEKTESLKVIAYLGMTVNYPSVVLSGLIKPWTGMALVDFIRSSVRYIK
jgi:hypothetical protein